MRRRLIQMSVVSDSLTKGGFFFQKVRFVFLNLQISKKNIPKNYPELEI